MEKLLCLCYLNTVIPLGRPDCVSDTDHTSLACNQSPAMGRRQRDDFGGIYDTFTTWLCRENSSQKSPPLQECEGVVALGGGVQLWGWKFHIWNTHWTNKAEVHIQKTIIYTNQTNWGRHLVIQKTIHQSNYLGQLVRTSF